MKKIVFISLVFLAVLNACSKSDIDKYPQEWQLVSQMSYQEHYLLKTDGTFIKSRTVSGVTEQATGTFKVVNNDWGKTYELTFSSISSLIESCTIGKEVLWVKSDTKMVSTWSECDGSFLEFKRL